MKKLLTVSLVAVMAVSAAHAKIASTDYVDDQVSPVATKVGSAEFSSGVAASHKGNVTAAIDAVAAAVAGLSSGDGSVASQIDAKINNLVNNGQVKTNTDAIATLNGDAETPGSVAAAVKAETDRATGEESRIEGLVTAEESRAKGEESRIEGLVTAEESRAKGEESRIAGLVSAETTRAEGVEAGLQTAINTINDGTNGILAQAKGYTDDKIGDLDGSASVVAYVGDKVGAVAGTVGNATNTLNQLVTVDQNGDPTGAGEFLQQYVEGAVNQEATRATTAEKKIAEYDAQGNLIGGSVKVNADAITNITKTDGIIDTKVNALANGAVQANTTAIANMDLTSQGEAGKFVSGVSQSDGQLSESLTDFAPEVVAGGKIAPTAGAVYTAVEGATDTAKTYTDTAISNLTAQDKVPTECRGNDENGKPIRCALIAVGGALQWEVVEY